MKNTEEIIEKFRREGNRITPQRRAIFKILVNNDSHPNAEDIFKQMKQTMPDVSRTTVYNTLKELNEMGAINMVSNVGENFVRYDPNTEDHHHLYCLKCHCIIDLALDFTSVDIPENQSQGFKIIKQQVTFFGYCPDCQKEIVQKSS